MVKKLKHKLYFIIAYYFRFWAMIQLLQWKPQIIVITGSSGKTTTMHLVESQLGETAHYSHHANSAYGICFDILGLSRQTLLKNEWLKLFLLAPIRAFKKPYQQKIYVAEVDCDRPKEGQFLAKFLKPSGVIWLSSTQTHSVNFQALVKAGAFKNIDQAIAYEFASLIESARQFVIVNTDNKQIVEQLPRTNAKIYQLDIAQCQDYSISKTGTVMKTDSAPYRLKQLVPKVTFYSLLASELLVDELGQTFDPTFKRFELPPGRSSLFAGIKQTTIIDSSYNSSADALAAMLELFGSFRAKGKKWLVVGDILEQGEREPIIHKNAAKAIFEQKLDKIVLVGPRVQKYTYPELIKLGQAESSISAYESPSDALAYIQEHIKGDETILFKGARFLEGVIEHLVADRADVAKLCRRELVWQNRRKKWGL